VPASDVACQLKSGAGAGAAAAAAGGQGEKRLSLLSRPVN